MYFCYQKRTVDRLLKKSNHVTKQSKGSSPEKSKDPGPMITYLMRVDGNSISFPEGIDISVFGDVPLSKKSTEVSSPRYCLAKFFCHQFVLL